MSVLVLRGLGGPWPGSPGPDPFGLTDAVRSALAVERRSEHHSIGPEDERRYLLTSLTIERIARTTAPALLAADAEALGAWIGTSAHPRAAASFHPPEDATGWLQALHEALPPSPMASALVRVRDEVARRSLGIVATNETSAPTELVECPDAPKASRSIVVAAPADVNRSLAAVVPTWPAFEASERRASAADRLWSAAVQAVRDASPISVGSSARHDVITEVLSMLGRSVPSPVGLRILYVDGSEAEPFPLHGNPQTPVEVDEPDLRLGLMSMRHTELDAEVDGYVFRNRLVSTARSFAATDQYCAEATVQSLTDLHRAGVRSIEVVQTGFEPAVIGFYRGVLASRDAGRPIVVRPSFLIRGRTAGTPWG